MNLYQKRILVERLQVKREVSLNEIRRLALRLNTNEMKIKKWFQYMLHKKRGKEVLCKGE